MSDFTQVLEVQPSTENRFEGSALQDLLAVAKLFFCFGLLALCGVFGIVTPSYSVFGAVSPHCPHVMRFGECAICADDPSFYKKPSYPHARSRRPGKEDGWRIPPKHQPGFAINLSMIPDKATAVYNPEAVGIVDYFSPRELIAKGRGLRSDEAAERAKQRQLRVYGNTGATSSVASHCRALTIASPESASPGFLVSSYGAYHWRLWAIAQGWMSPIPGHDYSLRSRLSRSIKTDEEKHQEALAWQTFRQELAKRLKAGEGWSPVDPREWDRVLPNGMKINLANRRVREILYEIDLHSKNYDTKEQLATDCGLNYETVRKKDLMSINEKKQCPTTPLTRAQVEHLKKKDGRAVFVHVAADRPRWYILDLDRYETYRDAVEAIKREGIDEALRKSRMWQNDRAPKSKHTDMLKEIWARWDRWFRPENIYILDLRTPMLVAIAEEAWEVEA